MEEISIDSQVQIEDSNNEGILSVNAQSLDIIEDVYMENIVDMFNFRANDIAYPLICKTDKLKKELELALYTSPAVIEFAKSIAKAVNAESLLVANPTNEQALQLATGAVKLMTKKDGSMLATLVNTQTGEFVSQVGLTTLKLAPELAQSAVALSSGLQMLQISHQMQQLQIASDEILQEFENDRLSTAYSCQQRFLQISSLKNDELKKYALFDLAQAAEDSRNALMLSQKKSIAEIENMKKPVIDKNKDKRDVKVSNLRVNYWAMNMASMINALCYIELGENESARESLRYYANYIQQNFFDDRKLNFIGMLNSIDPQADNYWRKELPKLQKNIQRLTGASTEEMEGIFTRTCSCCGRDLSPYDKKDICQSCRSKKRKKVKNIESE